MCDQWRIISDKVITKSISVENMIDETTEFDSARELNTIPFEHIEELANQNVNDGDYTIEPDSTHMLLIQSDISVPDPSTVNISTTNLLVTPKINLSSNKKV